MLLFCIQSSLQMDKQSKPVGHEWFCYSSDSLSLLLLLNIKHIVKPSNTFTMILLHSSWFSYI